MSDQDLFQDVVEAVEEEETVDVALDELKARRARLQSGQEALQEADFKTDSGQWKTKTAEKDWKAYSKLVSQFEQIAKTQPNSEEMLAMLLAGQVFGKNARLFKQYLPGKPAKARKTRVSKPKTVIPELEQFNEAVKEVFNEFHDWIQESESAKEARFLFIQLLGENPKVTNKDKNGNEVEVEVVYPEFTLYCSGSNPAKQYIRENYEEVTNTEE